MKVWLCGAVAAIVGLIPLREIHAQALPKVSSGRLERLDADPSRFIGPRTVQVWLPDGYDPATRYNVLYMHDGQMLFDASTTWNHQAWNVDATLGRLIREGRVAPTIVVGVFNDPTLRHAEYFPQKFLPFVPEQQRAEFLQKGLQGQPRSDAYLHYLVEELKPAIDAKYSTRPGPDGTFIMGSSMGGIISLYAMSEYPGVFGGAACLSTHWPATFAQNATFPLASFTYLQARLAPPQGHRLYMDHGNADLDGLYAPHQAFFDILAHEHGYTDANYLSRVYPEDGHNERAWAARLEVPLLFLLGK